MKKNTKKNLIEYGLIAAVMAILYFTGLHTEVLGFLQRGILATGVMNPKLEMTQPEKGEEARPVADFDLKLIDSKGVKTTMEDLRGKVIFFNIWATWCPPCIAEMPGINNLYNDMDKEEVAFIMLSVDQDFQKAIDFHQKKGYNFEVYKVDGALPQMYYTQSIPTTYVIDAQGDLALTHMGMGDYDTAKFKEFLSSLK